MVVGVHKTALQRVVVDISDGKLRAHTGIPMASYSRYAMVPVASWECGNVWSMRRPTSQPAPFAVNEVCGDDLLCDGLSHSKTLSSFPALPPPRAYHSMVIYLFIIPV